MISKESILTSAMLILVTYTLGLSLVSQAFPAGQTSTTFSSTGAIQIQTTAGIGVYFDAQGNTPLTSVSWGTLQPGGSQSVICYIKNEGSAATTLSLETSNWSSTAAETYLDLSWNYNGNPINPDAVVQITLTLTVAANIEGVSTFS
ncbi:unnamed protein product, partial [marine sediment metagenome]